MIRERVVALEREGEERTRALEGDCTGLASDIALLRSALEAAGKRLSKVDGSAAKFDGCA